MQKSPPARGRGLKLLILILLTMRTVSPPARGRGLKPLCLIFFRSWLIVAPRAGAWIETTRVVPCRNCAYCVAPRAGAWIETLRTCLLILS